MDDLNADTPATTSAVAHLSAEEMVRYRLAEARAAKLAADAALQAKRQQLEQNFPALLAEQQATIAEQVRMTIFYLNYHNWTGDCCLLDVVEGYTAATHRKWFTTRTYYEQRTQRLAARPLFVFGNSLLYLASDGKIYRQSASRFTNRGGGLLEGYHDINSSDMHDDDVYWPRADNQTVEMVLASRTEKIVRSLKYVRHEKLT